MAKWQWDDAYKRLDQAGRMLDAIQAPTPEAVRRILQERARTLARPEETSRQTRETVELVVLPVGDERYGVERDRVLEVAPVRGLIPLPGTPATIAGIVNWRGRMLTVVDLAAMFGLPRHAHGTARQVVVVEWEPIVFCLLATGPTQIASVAVSGPTLQTWQSPERTPCIKQITEDMVQVLDIGTLARAPEISVNQETQ